MNLINLLRDVFAEPNYGCRITRDSIDLFRLVVGDDNPIHFDEAVAKAKDFVTTPALGTQIVAIGEKYLDQFLRRVHLNGESNYRVAKQSITLPNSAYPGDMIRGVFEETSLHDEKDGTKSFIYQLVKETNGCEVPVLRGSVVLTDAHITPQDLDPRYIAHNKKMPINEATLANYNEAIDRRDDHVPYGVPLGFIISALLDLSKHEGKFRGITYQPYERPVHGTVDVDITVRRKRELPDGSYAYVVDAQTRQEADGRSFVSMYGELNVVTKTKFTTLEHLYKLRILELLSQRVQNGLNKPLGHEQ